MNADEPLYTLAKIAALCDELDPYGFCSKVDELLRGGLPASSWSEGRRSAQLPFGGFDNTDQWLSQQLRYFRQGIAEAFVAIQHAMSAQNAVCLVMDPDEAAMETTRMGTADDKLFCCVNCRMWNKRKGSQRPRAGRCAACYEYRRGHDGKDRPPELWEREIERQVG